MHESKIQKSTKNKQTKMFPATFFIADIPYLGRCTVNVFPWTANKLCRSNGQPQSQTILYPTAPREKEKLQI